MFSVEERAKYHLFDKIVSSKGKVNLSIVNHWKKLTKESLVNLNFEATSVPIQDTIIR